MKMKFTVLAVLLGLLLCSCAAPAHQGGVAATTLPVYQFTTMLCQGTGIPVTRLVTESVSCLHDYSLKVSQVKAIESADAVILSGAGLEDFMADALSGKTIVDASAGISLLEGCHEEGHEGHHHEEDPHIWLDPQCAMEMAENICRGLSSLYPAHAQAFEANLQGLQGQLAQLQRYGQASLSGLTNRELITFHDGFSYLAHSFDLHILEAIEEESGAEASAKELIGLISLVEEHGISSIFIEENGSVSAAQVIARETDARVYTLSMAMSGEDYFEAMYRNIDTLKEALG